MKWAYTHTHNVQPVRWTYPRVLMKPLVDPSAYREQMSPMCRKLDILSDMIDTHKATPAKVRSKK